MVDVEDGMTMEAASGGRRKGRMDGGLEYGLSLGEHQQLQVEYARALARAEHQEHQVRTLSDLSRSLSVALDLDELRQTIADAFYEALRADTTSLFVRDPEGSLRMVAQRNIDLTRARIIFGPDEGLVALAAREHRMIHVPDTATHTQYVATGYDQPRSLLAVPIEPESGSMAVICIVRRRVYAFTQDEMEFAHLMGSVVSHVLSNVAMYQEKSQLAREQATLNELMHLASASDGVASFAARAVELLCATLDASGCALILLGDDTAPQYATRGGSESFLAHVRGFARDAWQHASHSVALRCEVSPTGARMILAPVHARDALVAVIGWERQAGGRDHAANGDIWPDGDEMPADMLAFPSLVLSLQESLPLSESETAFITTVCQQVGMGIDNLRLRVRDMSTLRSISSLPASRTHLEALRRAIVREVAEAFAPASAALLAQDEGGALHVVASSVSENAGWLRAAMQLAQDAPERSLAQHRSIALARLEAEHETIGWLALRHDGTGKLSAERALVFTSLASTVALVLRNARLHLIAGEAAVDLERRRIAREMHDGVAQNLAHLMMRLELVQRLIPTDPAKALAEASGARQVLFASLNDLRQSIAALAPAQLEAVGFTGAVQSLLDDISTNMPTLMVELSSCPEEQIPAELRAPAFRVVQEALWNIRKHAHARHVWITIAITPQQILSVTVRDDGRGFTMEDVPAQGHFGVRGMRERAEEFGGTLSIVSTPKKGTTVHLELPLRLVA
jgi:signal transduction histidine kinase